MQYSWKYLKGSKAIRLILKCVIWTALTWMMVQTFVTEGLHPYQNYKDYRIENTFFNENTYNLFGTSSISQDFEAKGNLLSHVSVYVADGVGQEVYVTISDASKIIAESRFYTSRMEKNAWNAIKISAEGLKQGREYTITFSAEEALDCFLIHSGEAPSIFRACYSPEGAVNGTLPLGFQFTYRYFTLGSIFEMFFDGTVILLLALALAYAIYKFEDLIILFSHSGRKEGLSYAIFLSVTATLFYNPLDTWRNQITEFSRVIGIGVVNGVDATKRASNFSLWYLFWGITFICFFLLANALHKKEKSESCRKAEQFLDHFMILANCVLLFRCITFFAEDTNTESVFHFSHSVTLLVVIMALSYILGRLDRHLSVEGFGKLCFSGTAISYPLAVIVSQEWGNGRVLLGVMFVIAILLLALARFFQGFDESRNALCLIETAALVSSLAPLATSIYIELIHVLNQYGVFVAYPAKGYRIVVALLLGLWGMVFLFFSRKKPVKIKWKCFAYPVFILGIGCLACQIPLSSTYNPDLFEGANAGILISDFLQFGVIPNVEHYGGHMMTSVWEGILYGLINRDVSGAFVSPYANLLVPVLCVLFFLLVRRVWNEEAALFTALFFPFYSYWYYYGLGMLVCLSAISFVKKNTYVRAALVWAAFIWCALYRLDIGFAFGVATAISLGIYVINTRNWKAAKQLGITLAAWGIAGVCLWCLLCLAKGIHPLYRLMEFLMVNLSNQNWAYTEIGNTGITLFAWSYLVIPFLVILCLIYITAFNGTQKTIGLENWILMEIFGWCYFANFSRGLIRHSLVEASTTVVVWSGYLFLAMVFSLYKKNRKQFLPAFMLLMLCDTLFATDNNFVANSMADQAVSAPETIIESWKAGRFDGDGQKGEAVLTYWEQLKEDQMVVQRVTLQEDLKNYLGKYVLVDYLLEDGETFADFINKTLLYCLMNRKCPVYVSQSPLQLSGEFMQEAFIKEIQDVPLVLMPAETDYRCSLALDGIPNAYRYYKVAEYIYQNYIPLYRYGTDYTVWCLPERHEEYYKKLENRITCIEYVDQILGNNGLVLQNLSIAQERNGLILSYTGLDPMIMEMQNMIDLSPFLGEDLVLTIEYETNRNGYMQLFYTSEAGENYTAEKVETANIEGHGTAEFIVPITQYTRLRLDIPEKSSVTIRSLKASSAASYIDFGYDAPVETINADGTVGYAYLGALHNQYLAQLPRIWAEDDKEQAIQNPVLAELSSSDNIYVFEPNRVIDPNGNYLHLSATYDGQDINGLYRDNDEYVQGTVSFGVYEKEMFEEKYQYNFTFQEGRHDYLIRCSTDYYWYLGEVNAIKLQVDGHVYDLQLRILEGD